MTFGVFIQSLTLKAATDQISEVNSSDSITYNKMVSRSFLLFGLVPCKVLLELVVTIINYNCATQLQQRKANKIRDSRLQHRMMKVLFTRY